MDQKTKARKRPLCDEARLSILVRAWQLAPPAIKTELWRSFVTETADWLFAIVRSFRADLSPVGTADDIRAELVLHLHDKVLPAYRPAKGKLYSLVTFSCQKYILTLLEKQNRLRRHYVLAADYHETFSDADAEVDAFVWLEPEVYGDCAEIRERIDLFTAPREDGEFWLVCNLVVYAHERDRGRGSPPLEVAQIADVIAGIVGLSPAVALTRTEAALFLLRKTLGDFRGRPSLYAGEDLIDQSFNDTTQSAFAFDYSWQ